MRSAESFPVPQTWVEIGPLSAIPRLGARVVRTTQGDIAVFRNNDDEIFALADHCPHRGGPLSQGIVSGRSVTCPLHEWCVRLHDGGAEPPDDGRALRYPVRVDDGIVFLVLAPI